MHSFMDAKILAKNLRKSLAGRNIEQSHSDCLELIAQQFGLKDWNQLSARITATAQLAATDTLPLPRDWKITRQTDRAIYRIGLDPDFPKVAQIATRFGRDAGIVLPPDSYGCLMQSAIADRYRGKKVILRATVSTQDADGAAIWLRVDRSLGQVLRFDNMLDRTGEGALVGTNDWTGCRVVLDIPEAAASIHYGLLLKGYGLLRAKDLTLDEAADDASVTAGSRYLTGPSNLDFEAAA